MLGAQEKGRGRATPARAGYPCSGRGKAPRRWRVMITDELASYSATARDPEGATRQRITREVLAGVDFDAHPQGHHLWLWLPRTFWQWAEFVAHARRSGLLRSWRATPSRWRCLPGGGARLARGHPRPGHAWRPAACLHDARPPSRRSSDTLVVPQCCNGVPPHAASRSAARASQRLRMYIVLLADRACTNVAAQSERQHDPRRWQHQGRRWQDNPRRQSGHRPRPRRTGRAASGRRRAGHRKTFPSCAAEQLGQPGYTARLAARRGHPGPRPGNSPRSTPTWS